MKNKALRIAGYVVTVAAFGYLIWAIVKMHPDFTKISHPYAFIGVGLTLITVFVLLVYVAAFAWKLILSFLAGRRLNYPQFASVYARANIAKYLPGNVMHFAGRNLLAAKLGLTQLDIAFSSIVEVAMLLITACILSLALAFNEVLALLSNVRAYLSRHAVVGILIAAVIAALIIVFIVLVVRKEYFKKYRRFFTPSFALLALKLLVFYSITLLIPGLLLVALLAFAFGCSFTPHTALLTVASYIVSWVAGYVVIGAPGGVGVREAVMLFIIKGTIPSEILPIAVILLRVLSVIGDAIAFAVEPLVRRHIPPEPPESQP